MAVTSYDTNSQTTNPIRPLTPSDQVPWADRSVTLFWFEDGILQQTTSIADKRRLAVSDHQLMAAWSGKWKTDIIEVSREALLEAID